MFVTALLLHPCLIFAGKVEAYLSGDPLMIRLLWSALSLAQKYYTRVEVNSNDKHSSLLQLGNNYVHKKFDSTGHWV
jgi:hypothetical protein